MAIPANPTRSERDIEYRTWLPIFLLVASGYVLGAAFPSVLLVGWVVSWLTRKLGYFGVLLTFGFLFYSGRNRLLELARHPRDGTSVGLTKGDVLLASVAFALPAIFAVCFIAGLGFAAGYLVYSWGLNRYLSWGIGVFVFLGILGFALTEDIWQGHA